MSKSDSIACLIFLVLMLLVAAFAWNEEDKHSLDDRVDPLKPLTEDEFRRAQEEVRRRMREGK